MTRTRGPRQTILALIAERGADELALMQPYGSDPAARDT